MSHTVQWDPIPCDCGKTIVEQQGHFIRYRCRDRRCTEGSDEKVRIVYIDIAAKPPRVVTREMVEEELDNG